MINIKELLKISTNMSVIYAEDEDKLREKFEKYLKNLFSDVRVVGNGADGLIEYEKRASDIVITDIKMPILNGIEMLKEIVKIDPYQNIIITSAYTDSDYLVDAIKLGVGSYIIKPFNNEQIIETIYKEVSKIHQARENKEYHQHLEELVKLEVKEREKLQFEKIDNYEQTLLGLVNLIEQRDSYTGGHSQRVAKYSKMIAKEMNYSDEECNLIYKAGILHDIGKIATPDAILLKPGKLNEIEYKLIQEHVNVGFKMLHEIPMFKTMSEIIYSHHERYDGHGYPNGLKGDEINKLSHIMIIADSFDAMTTSRIYKSRKNVAQAIEEIKSLSAKQFHPKVASHAVNVLANIEIDNSIDQFPQGELEHERFVYFFNDRITGLFNQDYLNITFLKNKYNKVNNCIYIISLHNFKDFNSEKGWESGNKLLHNFANKLKDHFKGHMLFRIHANDFIILSQEPIDIDTAFFEDIAFLEREDITYSVKQIYNEDDNIETLQDVERQMYM